MVTNILENLEMITKQVKELIFMPMGMYIKGNGLMILSMEMEQCTSYAGIFMKDHGKMVKKKITEFINLLKGIYMKVNF